MRFVMFYHSLVSDWNHGNAHFLRGVANELIRRGNHVRIYEPDNGWSYRNLVSQHGDQPLRDFEDVYPELRSLKYNSDFLDLDQALDGADVVMVHEWNPSQFIAKLGQHRKHSRYRLYFHDTHHRCVTSPDSMGLEFLRDYDGVLTFGESLRRLYEEKDCNSRVWVWHEAADTHVFQPLERIAKCGDLVWIGNWGDEERTRELRDFLFAPVQQLELSARVYGVRYPAHALAELAKSAIPYSGWTANFRVPQIFAGFDMTVHIPRRPYREGLPGVPTIRVFEALACGIPLVCAPWDDSEHLFEPGKDYLVAQDTAEMTSMLKELKTNPALRADLSAHGLATIQARHTCRHRVDQLLEIVEQ